MTSRRKVPRALVPKSPGGREECSRLRATCRRRAEVLRIWGRRWSRLCRRTLKTLSKEPLMRASPKTQCRVHGREGIGLVCGAHRLAVGTVASGFGFFWGQWTPITARPPWGNGLGLPGVRGQAGCLLSWGVNRGRGRSRCSFSRFFCWPKLLGFEAKNPSAAEIWRPKHVSAGLRAPCPSGRYLQSIAFGLQHSGKRAPGAGEEGPRGFLESGHDSPYSQRRLWAGGGGENSHANIDDVFS